MNIVIDLILIGIILLCIYLSAKRGFVKVLIETVGFIAAIILAFTISSPLADITYDKIIEPPMIEAASNAVGENTETSALEALPGFIVNSFGDEISVFTEKIDQNLSQGTETAVRTASQQVVKPIATKLLGLLFTAILFLLLLVVVKFLAKFLNGIFSFSIIGNLNRTLGGVIGIIRGIIFVLIFCTVISIIISFTGKPFLIFSQENIENSVLFKFFTDIIPFN